MYIHIYIYNIQTKKRPWNLKRDIPISMFSKDLWSIPALSQKYFCCRHHCHLWRSLLWWKSLGALEGWWCGVWTQLMVRIRRFWDLIHPYPMITLQETNISHLGKRNIIFKYALSGGYVNSLEGIIYPKQFFEAQNQLWFVFVGFQQRTWIQTFT